MFETLSSTRGDSLLALINAYRSDSRPLKVDVGVGVYRDETGQTPVMRAVKKAEAQLLSSQKTKAYVGLIGNVAFNSAMNLLVLGDQVGFNEHLRTVQTPGGTAALRALLDLVCRARASTKVWVSDPTWINHPPLVVAARLEVCTYPYYDHVKKVVRFEEMVASLSRAARGDVVLFHGCCHNPTGTDLSEAQWLVLTDLALSRGFIPLIDLAYQGFGHGIDEDAFAIRHMASRLPELMVAVSCSKTFAVYRERVGCAMIFSKSPRQLNVIIEQLLGILRANYSMPPDHGASVVAAVLNDSELRASWSEELLDMRARLQKVRRLLATEFRKQTGSGAFDFLEEQVGMFSLLGLQPSEVVRLREEHAIYMAADSRINIAGLASSQVGYFVKGVLAVRP